MGTAVCIIGERFFLSRIEQIAHLVSWIWVPPTAEMGG